MNQCFRCGISGDKAKLHEAISNEGIVKVCEDCSSIENMPLIKKPSEDKFNESPRQKSVHERMVGMSRTRPMGREISLRELVDRDLKAKKIQNPPDLIDNFHWVIQRIRRARKITREEFAKGINEPESTIRMVEQGFLPENNYKAINKIESFFKISLRKPGSSGFPDTTEPVKKYSMDSSMASESDKLAFDSNTTKKLKIADLLKMKKKQEEKPKEEEKTSESWEEEYSQDDERFLDPKEEEEFEEEE